MKRLRPPQGQAVILLEQAQVSRRTDHGQTRVAESQESCLSPTSGGLSPAGVARGVPGNEGSWLRKTGTSEHERGTLCGERVTDVAADWSTKLSDADHGRHLGFQKLFR